MQTPHQPFTKLDMDDHRCAYVSTCGLALSCDQHPCFGIRVVNGARTRSRSYKFETRNPSAALVYVQHSELDKFAGVLNRFDNPIILLSGGTDTGVPDDLPDASLFLEHPKVLRWFTQNCLVRGHPKLRPLPIGLDYHTLQFCQGAHAWGQAGQSALEQERVLVRIRESFRPLGDCVPRCTANFQLSMDHPPRRANIRRSVYEILRGNTAVDWLPAQTRPEFWRSCERDAFVICPPGNGIDTHRAWEALLLGRIPIVLDHVVNSVYEDLPIVEVASYEEVDGRWLHNKLEEVCQNLDRGKYNLDKLSLQWHVGQLRREQERLG